VLARAFFEQKGNVSVGARVTGAGCGFDSYKNGYFFTLSSEGQWWLSAGGHVLSSGHENISPSAWHQLHIKVQGNAVSCWLDGKQLASANSSAYGSGWAALGTGYHYAQFDDFELVRL
jgi:hypothetical protein